MWMYKLDVSIGGFMWGMYAADRAVVIRPCLQDKNQYCDIQMKFPLSESNLKYIILLI
jgi:hypothetical protein